MPCWMGFPFCDLVSASALESRFSFPPNGISFPPPHQARSAAVIVLSQSVSSASVSLLVGFTPDCLS